MLINGEFVDDGLVRLEATRVKEYLRGQSPNMDPLAIELQAREVARERIIEQTLLHQEANRDQRPIPGEAIEAEVRKYNAQNPQQAGCLLPRDQETQRSHIEADLRLQRFIAAITANVPKPTSKQVSAFYQRTKQTLIQPENVHAAHIVKNVDESAPEGEARAAIEKIEELLKQGMPFEQAADEHSDCPGRGGDLGFFVRGQMVEEFDSQVFDLPPDKLSPIFRTPFGFHIAKVYEHGAQRVPTLSEVRERLEDDIWLAEKQEAVRAYMEGVRARAEVRKSK
jgi:parvulin-like peptidyl-prolyl isomerase